MCLACSQLHAHLQHGPMTEGMQEKISDSNEWMYRSISYREASHSPSAFSVAMGLDIIHGRNRTICWNTGTIHSLHKSLKNTYWLCVQHCYSHWPV